jgi:hypothetical protein
VPVVNPGSRKPMPNDWRWAWQEFQRLKEIARRAKIDTSSWKLEFPTRTQKIFDPRWRMTYTYRVGNTIRMANIYLGSNGRVAGETIKKMIPGYEKSAVPPVPKVSKSKALTTDPLFDPNKVRKAFELWNCKIAKVRSTQDLEAFKREYPKLYALMNRKAGFLDMSLYEYLTRHPYSSLFPAPPRSKQEHERRLKAFEKHVKDKDDARKQQREAHGPGWITTF